MCLIKPFDNDDGYGREVMLMDTTIVILMALMIVMIMVAAPP